MKLLSCWRAVVVAGNLGLLATAGAADANRTQTDGTGEGIATVCGTSGACNATPLGTSFGTGPLTANFGFGPFSSVYFYTNGLVSIGGPLASSNFTSLAAAAVPGGYVFTAGYSPTMTLSSFTIEGPQNAANGTPTNKQVVRVRYSATFTGSTGSLTSEEMEFNIFDLGGGSYELELNHGNQNGTGSIDFPTDGYLGYYFNGNAVQLDGSAVQAADRANTDFAYIFRAGTTPAVPEPGTWAMLLIGFAGAGAALRRTRRPLALA